MTVIVVSFICCLLVFLGVGIASWIGISSSESTTSDNTHSVKLAMLGGLLPHAGAPVQAWRAVLLSGEPHVSSTGSEQMRIAARRDAAQRLLAQVLSLPGEYREPLLLRCVRSLSYQQISLILDMPVTTVETRLARARRMLREEVGEEVAAEMFTARRGGRAST